MEQYDVVIVGGAVTGSILALALSSFTQHRLRIAIVEKQLPDYTKQGGFDARSIALAQGSLQKLSQIQPLVGDNLATVVQTLATPIHTIHVSDQHHFGKTTLRAALLSLPQLGVVVELAKLGAQLTALLAQHHNIRLFCPDTVLRVAREREAATLTLNSGSVLTTSLMVAADGIRSPLAHLCQVQTLTLKDYHQSAIIANVEISEDHHFQAFERFTPQGPLALLPLSDKRMSLVWCRQDPTSLMECDEVSFLTTLQQHFGWRLGKFKRLSQRFCYPLTSQRAESHIHHRLAIAGNAAQLLHPVAGQGFNLGLRDLITLAELVSQAFNQQQDIGDYHLLLQYQRLREADQSRLMQMTSGLIALFSHETIPLQLLRNMGLGEAAHSACAQRYIANSALGWQ